MTLKALLLMCLLPVAGVYAAEPQATPTQCLLPEQGGTAKPGKNGSFDFEKCLLKAGVRNFTRAKTTLTVHLDGGKSVRYKDKRSDGEDYAAYTYAGYDPVTGLHMVDYSGYEWGGVELIDHQSGWKEGFGISLLPGAFSPGRQFIVGTDAEPSCGNGLYVHRIPARGQGGNSKAQELPDNSTICDEIAISTPKKIDWLSDSSFEVTWQCEFRGKEGSYSDDKTTLSLQGTRWQTSRTPCQSPTATQAAGKSTSGQTLQANTLRAGMTLEEVEKLLGRSADRFKINPLALLGKQEITRVWTANGRQLEVTFVGGVVASWR